MPLTIKDISAREVLDSRGDPTVEVTVTASNGVSGTAVVPSGASTGVHEAHELRDGDKKRYNGRGVLQAVANVETKIKPAVCGLAVTAQQKIDQTMIDLDGTAAKHKLGANAILGVSLAAARTAAQASATPLYRYLQEIFALPAITIANLPWPMMNVINGGRHASNDLDVQEFIIIPHLKTAGVYSAVDSIRAGSEVFHTLADVLKKKKLSTDVGNEGGYAPRLATNDEALDLIVTAIKESGYQQATEVGLGLDVAASEFYQRGKYNFAQQILTSQDMIDIYKSWQNKYKLALIEDGLAEDDWQGWHELTAALGKQTLLIGDDLFVTNKERLALGLELAAANGILIKPNQIGTLTETIATVQAARQADYKIVVSHRSGETMDTFIVDLAVAVGAPYLKAGSTSRGERVVKYNRLMEIEEEIRS